MKNCITCKVDRELDEFNKTKLNKDGHHNVCRICTKEYKKKFHIKHKENISKKAKENYSKNKDKIKEKTNKFYHDNKEKISQQSKLYRDNNKEKIKEQKKKEYVKNREKYLNYQKKYRTEYPEKVNKIKRDWNKNNPHVVAWRYGLKSVLKRLNKQKEGLTIDLLGYSALELKNYIEPLFTDGMSWDNYGEWHIDHIKPVSSFDPLTEPNVVNALSNLQPLWATTREINGVIYEGNLNKGC